MKKVNLLSIVIAFIMFSGTINAQNIAISDVSHTADASAVLDVYSTTKGMLVPCMNTAPSSPANGLIYFNTGDNSFYYNAGNATTPDWRVVTYGQYWSRNASGELYTTTSSDYVGIGQTHAGMGLTTWLTLRDHTGTTFPQFYIIGDGGDASMKYSIWNGEKSYSHGIFLDNIGSDNNFKICNTGTLTGPGYTDVNTMMEIHDENAKAGIIDFNHQSRARVFQTMNPIPEFVLFPYVGQFIPFATWTQVNFDAVSYDEHTEWALAPSAIQGPSNFVVTEDGYYQVNARVDFCLEEYTEQMPELTPITYPNYPGYVSIAIYVSSNGGQSWTMYAQGNKLQGVDNIGTGGERTDLKNNLAPNISDVVKLNAGDYLDIRVWQNLGNSSHQQFPGIPLRVLEQNGQGGNPTQIYVSIHKSS